MAEHARRQTDNETPVRVLLPWDAETQRNSLNFLWPS